MTPGTDDPEHESTETDGSDTEESASTPGSESDETDQDPETATSASPESPADTTDDPTESTPGDQTAAGDTPPETEADPPDTTDTGPSDAATGTADQTAGGAETHGPTDAEDDSNDTDDTVEASPDATGEPSDADPGADSTDEAAATEESDADAVTEESDADAGAPRTDDAVDDTDTDAGRDPADLTPDEVEVSRPDEYEFKHLPKDLLPPDVQYTPEFDPDWVYPSGTKDGGRRDDVPVQGLEIGVLASEETVEQVVEAVLEALELYHDVEGVYPRHRIVKSAATFRELTDWEVGLAAVFQPRPDAYEGLTEHMTDIQQGDATAVDANRDRARRLVQFLLGSLVYHDIATIGHHPSADLASATGWDAPRQVADSAIVERYGPLAATEVYDLTDGAVDISSDGVESVVETDLSPAYLEVEDVADLF